MVGVGSLGHYDITDSDIAGLLCKFTGGHSRVR